MVFELTWLLAAHIVPRRPCMCIYLLLFMVEIQLRTNRHKIYRKYVIFTSTVISLLYSFYNILIIIVRNIPRVRVTFWIQNNI